MDILNIIQLALFVPFFLLLAIFSIAYMINGYKKGGGKSFLSLAATCVAVALSLLLAKLISRACSGSVYSMLPRELILGLQETGTLAPNLVHGAIEVLLSFLLFVLFFIIVLPILRALAKKIPLGKLDSDKLGSRLAGMGIRTVEAVLMTVMLLLPLYGTISIAAPPAAAVLRIAENLSHSQQQNYYSSEQIEITRVSYVMSPQPSSTPEMSDIVSTVEAVANHPVLLPYKYGPGAWVYSDLSTFSMNDSTVDVAAAATSLNGLLERVQVCWNAIASKNTQGAVTAMEELIDYARKEVIYQQWSYDMAMAMVGEIDALIEQYSAEISAEEELANMITQVRPLLDMSFDDYTHNAEGLLDFASWFIETLAKTSTNALDAEALANIEFETVARIGKLINHSEQAIGLKRILMQIFAQTMFDVLPDAQNPEYADYYASRADVPNSGIAFIEKYFGDGTVSEENYTAEGAAFLIMLNSSNALDTAEAFVRHPLFGADAVLEAMDEYLYINGNEGYFTQSLSENKNLSKICKNLDAQLASYENVSVVQPVSFNEYVFSYLAELYGLI